eukprot:TRINITY_DN2032_c0_g1_i1.p1 TRINITY_DN2032_c0_g1~~TRINITY_DN2032_c0_g1_i1.p1  ORF type:complete len:252 (+),score=61.25 TRINITY_DN2032_c0_g1_i1:93-848(+)
MVFKEADVGDMTGKVVVVTGANSGIGKETVRVLASRGAKVYLGARNPDKAQEAIKDIISKIGESFENNIVFLQMDLADIQSIRSAAERLIQDEPEIHVLINNAGVMATPYEFTKDGYEMQWGTNVVGHFVLTKLLLPTLQSTAKNHPKGTVRIINVSSVGHKMAPRNGISFEDTRLPNSSAWTRYGQSKLGNILMSKEIAKRYAEDGIFSISLHPGGIRTGLYQSTDMSKKWYSALWHLATPFLVNPPEGA